MSWHVHRYQLRMKALMREGSLQKFPFSMVEARERSSCCLRSAAHPAKSASCLVNPGLTATFRRQERDIASLKPEAMPCPPTKR